MPGSWQRSDPLGDPGRHDYVPDADQGCSYFQHRRAELLDKLLGEVRRWHRGRTRISRLLRKLADGRCRLSCFMGA